MIKQVSEMLNKIQWEKSDVAEFLGQYLSEPKPHVVFDQLRLISEPVFHSWLEKSGIRLSGKSQMLFHGNQFFINGEQLAVAETSCALMQQLADNKFLAAGKFSDKFLLKQCYEWYLAGYVEFPQ